MKDTKKISWTEIKEKKYIVIENKVYNIAQFKALHPGGEPVIAEYEGEDATQAFNNVKHSLRAKEMLSDFYVGDLDLKSKKTMFWRSYFVKSFLVILVSVLIAYFLIY